MRKYLLESNELGLEERAEHLLIRNWNSLSTKERYWKGSPWRAFSLLRQYNAV